MIRSYLATEHIPCPIQGFTQFSSTERIHDSQESPYKTGRYKRKKELARSDPGADSGSQLQIAHPHAAKKTRYSKEQKSQTYPAQALAGSGPASRPDLRREPGYQIREH
jgi:hypothetical protein